MSMGAGMLAAAVRWLLWNRPCNRKSGHYMLFSLPLALFFLMNVSVCAAQTVAAPEGLRVDLLRQPEKVYRNGFPVAVFLEEAVQNKDRFQFCTINSQAPAFSWEDGTCSRPRMQVAYRIMLARTRKALENSDGEIWDSGMVPSSACLAIRYAGKALQPSTIYYWKVKVWYDDHTETRFSDIQSFCTGKDLHDQSPSFVLQRQVQIPSVEHPSGKTGWLYDFGKDGFGQVELKVTTTGTRDTLYLHVGEALTPDGHINRKPAGTIRYRLLKVPLLPGTRIYRPAFSHDKLNTGPKAVHLPDYIGEVLPFRYIEIDSLSTHIRIDKMERLLVTNHFEEEATVFRSSDTALNRLWDLCKYTVKATSFTGYYIDGDRERIPYEADALINQLSHYSCDAEFTTARRSLEYLIGHPTWPAEWSMQNILIAWNDYLYSGDDRELAKLYPDLKSKLLTALSRSDGLISTRTGQQTAPFLASIHYQTFNANLGLKDIVDWPQHSILPSGETDDFDFKDYNAVVNAYHYAATVLMSCIAGRIGHAQDSIFYQQRAQDIRSAFSRVFLDPVTGLVLDGEGSHHSSLHANMFALAFGLVPEAHVAQVLRFIHSRGMVCSVYGAQFLLSALYEANDQLYALQLLRSQGKRSWFNMLNEGATMTMEAWGQDYKPNQDWNHAWGTAPANYLVRNFMGIQPLTAGFADLRIKPEPGDVRSASIRYQTIRGPVEVGFENRDDYFKLSVCLPSNTTSSICLPYANPASVVTMDGKAIATTYENGFWVIRQVSSGMHLLMVKRQ